MIAPLFQVGDTGYICHALGSPVWITIFIGLAGAITLYFVMNSLMKYFVEMASKEIITNKPKRKVFLRYLLIYPLVIGIIITTLLNFPIPVYLSLIAPVCTPLLFYGLMAMRSIKNMLRLMLTKHWRSSARLNRGCRFSLSW